MKLRDFIRADCFYPIYYLRRYADLRDKPLTYALTHYKRHGIREGRSPNPFFDPTVYFRKNPDLARIFPGDNTAALNHWLKHGIKEGRQGSTLFHAEFYFQKYPDVRRIYGKTSGAPGALMHYLEHGHKEGRVPSANLTDADKRWWNEQIFDIPDLASKFQPLTAKMFGESAKVSVQPDRRIGHHYKVVLPNTTAWLHEVAAAVTVVVGLHEVFKKGGIFDSVSNYFGERKEKAANANSLHEEFKEMDIHGHYNEGRPGATDLPHHENYA